MAMPATEVTRVVRQVELADPPVTWITANNQRACEPPPPAAEVWVRGLQPDRKGNILGILAPPILPAVGKQERKSTMIVMDC